VTILTSTFPVLLDLLMVGLLIATIFYAVSLQRSLSRLRDGKAELASLLEGLSESVARAEISITGMKAAAGEYDASLAQRIGTARALVDELQVINETANNLATRIERAVQAGRTATTPTPAGRPTDSRPAEPKAAEPRTAADDADPFAPLLAEMGAGKKSAPPGGKAGRGKASSADRELLEAIELLRRAN
jgi:hypothetical protein